MGNTDTIATNHCLQETGLHLAQACTVPTANHISNYWGGTYGGNFTGQPGRRTSIERWEYMMPEEQGAVINLLTRSHGRIS